MDFCFNKSMMCFGLEALLKERFEANEKAGANSSSQWWKVTIMELTSHVVYRGRGHTHCITQELKQVTSSHSIFSISYTIFFPQCVLLALLVLEFWHVSLSLIQIYIYICMCIGKVFPDCKNLKQQAPILQLALGWWYRFGWEQR